MDYKKEKEEYIRQHSTPEDPVLAELNRLTHLKMLNPTMLSGHHQGKFLEMVSFMIRPRQILEVGTFTAYSAICMAKGLQQNGKLHTIDINDEIKEFARDFIRKSGMEDRIIMHTGNALVIIPSLSGPFDLVFIDAEKSEYIQYYNVILPKVRSGGIIIADNVLWDNKVFRPEYNNDEYTGYMKEFNKLIQQDKQVENILLPVRDGLMFIRKK